MAPVTIPAIKAATKRIPKVARGPVRSMASVIEVSSPESGQLPHPATRQGGVDRGVWHPQWTPAGDHPGGDRQADRDEAERVGRHPPADAPVDGGPHAR